MVALALVASSADFANAALLISTLNSAVLTPINNNLAPAGAGSVSGAINIPAVTAPVNLLSITGGATGSPVLLGPGGPSAGTSVDLILSGNNPSGVVGLGGIGNGKAGAAAQFVANSTNANGLLITGAASGSMPLLSVFGSDTNPDFLVQAKGTGSVAIGGTGTTKAGAALQVASVGTQVNGFLITPAISGSDPSIAVFGSDSNRNFVLSPLGTGTLKFGTTGPITANGTVAATFTVTSAPTGASTSIQRWLNFIDSTGRAGFIPVF